jgi:hypothetical protein
MAKTAALAIRIDPKLKSMLEREAKKDGRSVASYVEHVLTQYRPSGPPKWILRDPQPHNFEKRGVAVSLAIAEGWPLAVMPADHAADLGKQLIECSKIAAQMPRQ